MSAIFSEIKLESRPEKSYSVSRLKSYEGCSQFYKNRYIDKIVVSTLSESTVMGSIVHNALELLYTTEDETINYLIDALKASLTNSLAKLRITSVENAEPLSELLWEFASDINHLHVRASASYTNSDAIRTKDGKVAVNPQMTSTWKKAEKELDLDSRKQSIDLFVVNRNPDFNGLSITNLFSEAYNICLNYRTPPEITDIIAVEMPISHWHEETKTLQNPVLMPASYGQEENIYLNGYLDFVCKVKINGKIVTAIVDHKSSKSAYESEQVSYNRQLMAYVYAYELLTGDTVEAIGINNLRSNTLAVDLLDRDRMKDAIHSLFSAHTLIKLNIFTKQMPEDNYSKCLANFGRKCDFLEVCHPEVYQQLKLKEQYA